jgi:hypothetical protein
VNFSFEKVIVKKKNLVEFQAVLSYIVRREIKLKKLFVELEKSAKL